MAATYAKVIYAGGIFEDGKLYPQNSYFLTSDDRVTELGDLVESIVGNPPVIPERVPNRWTESTIQKITITADGPIEFAYTPPNSMLILFITQDSTGGYTVTLPITVKWAGGTIPTLTTTAGSTDILTFFYDGTDYYCLSSALDLAIYVP